MSSIVQTLLVSFVLCLVQFLVAVPWVVALDPRGLKTWLRDPLWWLKALGGVAGAAILLSIFISSVQDPGRLVAWGRIFGGLLHAQLTITVFALAFPLLMLVWPHGGAVALAAFREGVRQPMYWLILALVLGWMTVSPFIPYFTFGEDFKVVRELGYDSVMLAGVIFSVLAASTSISEEIEGRTAITVMSKPVSRRQFLVGKFLGILAATMLMTGLLGTYFNGVMWFKLVFDGEQVSDPQWLEPARQIWYGRVGEPGTNFALGVGYWFDTALDATPGLVFGFCQVMVLLAIAVALSTRLPFLVNVVTCLVVFFLGHLTHILVQVSQGSLQLINFMARVFETILPGLEYFDLGPVIVRDIPPDRDRFILYTGSVVLYAVLYSIIALVLGLILFEDRDLA